jgi:uncharacterized protein
MIEHPTKKGAIAVFVKTPSHSKIKTRLEAGVGKKNAEAFHISSANCVAAVADLASDSLGTKPYFAVAELMAMNSPSWKRLSNYYQGEGGLGQRLHHVYSGLQKSHGFAILLGADSPQLEISDLKDTVAWLTESRVSRFAFGPAVDGGFWLFGGNRPLPESLWNTVEYSKPSTGSDFLSRISPLGSVKILRSLTDGDRKEDLEKILTDFEKMRAPLQEQLSLISLCQTICARKKNQA